MHFVLVDIYQCILTRISYFVKKKICLSDKEEHSINSMLFIMCLSIYKFHMIYFTVCISHDDFHSIYFKVCIYLYAFHGMNITLCFLKNAFHSAHFTVCIWQYIFTVSISQYEFPVIHLAVLIS